MSVAAVVRPLHIAAGFQPAGAAAPVSAELTLSHARIPVGGGSFDFYLIDANAPSRAAIPIGKLAFEGPPAPEVRDLRVHVELGPAALALLRSAHAPAVRIVPRRAGNEPLLVKAIELHAAP